jgi:hypothetical protein
MPEAPPYKDAYAVRDAYQRGELSEGEAMGLLETPEYAEYAELPEAISEEEYAEQEKQIRATVKAEDAQKAKEEAEGPGFWDRIANAITRGYQGYKQTTMDPFSDPEQADFADISTAAAVQQNMPMGKGLKEFYESDGFGESVKNLFAHDYGGTLLELVAESMGSYLPTVVERAPGRAAAGTAMGAGLGSVIPGIGTGAGALTGLSAGMTETFGSAALALEYSNIILGGLQKKGIDVTNANALETAFTDDEVMGNLRTEAIKGGIPVALFDMVTGRIGGRFLAGAKKSGSSRAVATAKEFATQGAGGAAGEATKSVVLGEEISAPGVVGEFFGEGPTHVIQIATGYAEKTAGDKKAPKVPPVEPQEAFLEIIPPDVPLPSENTAEAAQESLDKTLDQVEAPKPDVTKKAEEVNQAAAERQEEAPADPKKKESAPGPVVPDSTPEQQEQAAKEDVEKATEQAASQPDPDSIPANQEVFNALHRYARLAKKQGKTLEQWASENGVEINDAVQAAWDDADNETPSRVDDMPPEVNTGLGDNNVRNRALKFANADLSNETVGGVGNVGYERRSNETDAEYAQRDIQDKGLSGAVGHVVGDDQMPPAQRTIYQSELLQQLRDDEKKAKGEGDKTREDQRVSEQIKIIEELNDNATTAGQYLQAFSHLSKLSAGGFLRYAKNTYKKITKKKVAQAEEALKRVRDTLREVEEGVVKQVIAENEEKLIGNDPRVKKATRKHVGELIASEEKPETAEVVRQHYADPKGTLVDALIASGMDEKTAKRHARRIDAKYRGVHARVSSEVKKRAKGVLKKMPLWKRYKNETVAKLTRAVSPSTKKTASPALQKFTNRLSNNLRKRMESLRPERKASIDKLTDEQILAEGISNLEKYEEIWLDTQQELYEQENLTPEQIAQLDEVFKNGSPMAFNASTMDRAIRAAQVRLEQDANSVIKQGRQEQGDARRTVVQNIIERTGLEGEEAQALTSLLNKRYLELSRRKKKTALKRLNKTDGVTIPVTIKRQYEKIIEWSNLGAFSDAQFDEELANRLDLPHLSEKLKKDIMRQARVIESKPEGFQKQREVLKLMNLIAGEKTFGVWDLFWDFWFANVLSGLSTQTINLAGSAANLLAHTITHFMRHPGDLTTMMRGVARGMIKGINEGAEVFSTGFVTGTRLDKYQQTKNLEMVVFRGGKFSPLNYLKYVGRALSTGDMFFFKAAEEMKQSLLARNVAKSEKLSGKALYRRTQEILNNTKPAREKATRQADKEGLKGLDRRRRIAELMEMGDESLGLEGRPSPEEAKEYALRVIYTNKPYGVLGLFAQKLNEINADQPWFRMFAPFVNIVSNVTNESLNYFAPVGYMRYRQAVRKGQLYGQPLSEVESIRKDQLGDQAAKTILGTSATVAVMGLAWSFKDDEDPWFMIFGKGPKDYGKNRSWRAIGGLPYSMKIGDKYIPYKDTVLAIPFAVIGSMFDAMRFNNSAPEEYTQAFAMGLMSTAGVITENSYLKGLMAVSKWISQPMTGETAEKVIFQQISRTGVGALVPFGGLLRDIDRFQDPTRYDGMDTTTMLYSQIPFVRRLNKPTLNVLGEPVEMHVSDRYWSTPRASEELRWLVEKNAYPSFPNINSTVNVAGRDMDPDEFYDYIKISGEGIRARVKSELFDNRQIWNQLPDGSLKIAVDKIVKEERSKTKGKLFTRYPNL